MAIGSGVLSISLTACRVTTSLVLMSKVVYKMEQRYGADSRLMHIGRQVQSASKDSFIDKLKPSYQQARRDLLPQVQSMLRDELEANLNVQRRRLAVRKNGTVCALKQRIKTQEVENEKLISSFSGRISGYRLSTLELMVTKGKLAIAPFANAGVSDTFIREALSFRPVLKGGSVALASFFNNVRMCGPQFALEDLSDLNGADREHAELILKLAVEIWKHQHLTIRDRHTGSRKLDEEREDIDKTMFVSPALAALVVERPDVIEAIPDYLQSNPLPFEEIQVGHLVEYLDIPSRALAIGAL